MTARGAHTDYTDAISRTPKSIRYKLTQICSHTFSIGNWRRKRALLAHLHRTRQRLLRLHVLAQWGNMAPAAGALSRALDAAARQSDAARDAADQLALAHAHITAVQARFFA